ncbi:hypothetical protein ACJRO7_024983 [Eucalyptus globulus]|uniref:FAS1 domain-containing protein n=1 Tax=Eucalyptus globulus TaxID=34317 RepID=A0ABD3KCT2_EUCGL
MTLTAGNAPSNIGFVNITDLQGSKVGFGAVAPRSKLDSSYTKSVKQIPYNISVLKLAPPSWSRPSSLPRRYVRGPPRLEQHHQDVPVSAGQGPDDVGARRELVSLLLYHSMADYTPIGSLKTSNAPISTLATNGAGKYDFTLKTVGDSIVLDTEVNSSWVANTMLNPTPVTIFTIDSVLLPAELFGKSLSPAPAPELVSTIFTLRRELPAN